MSEQVIAHLLRRGRLLPIAFRLAFLASVVRCYPDNRRFEREHPGVPLPPLRHLHETSGTVSYRSYYTGGLRTATNVYHRMSRHLPDGPIRICDWGCGPARVVRHLPTIDGQRTVEAYGSDFNPDMVSWCRTHIENVDFRLNGLEPPLDFEDAAFDCLYSFSVYTHIPAHLQQAWLHENLRVVRPGGLVQLTFLGDSFKHRLLAEEREVYETQGMVSRGEVEPGSAWFTTYHNPRFVEETFLEGLEIVERKLHPEGAPPWQDIWLVRKP